MRNPFRYFNSSPEVIRLAVMMYIRYPLSLRQVEDLLFVRGIDICHETVRCWWNRFGPMFAGAVRKPHRKAGYMTASPTTATRHQNHLLIRGRPYMTMPLRGMRNKRAISPEHLPRVVSSGTTFDALRVPVPSRQGAGLIWRLAFSMRG